MIDEIILNKLLLVAALFKHTILIHQICLNIRISEVSVISFKDIQYKKMANFREPSKVKIVTLRHRLKANFTNIFQWKTLFLLKKFLNLSFKYCNNQ